MKDLEGEKEALSRYLLHILGEILEASMGLFGPSSSGRLRFYVDLEKEILISSVAGVRVVAGRVLSIGLYPPAVDFVGGPMRIRESGMSRTEMICREAKKGGWVFIDREKPTLR